MYLIHRELPVNHNRNETTVIVSLNVNLIHIRRNYIFFIFMCSIQYCRFQY